MVWIGVVDAPPPPPLLLLVWINAAAAAAVAVSWWDDDTWLGGCPRGAILKMKCSKLRVEVVVVMGVVIPRCCKIVSDGGVVGSTTVRGAGKANRFVGAGSDRCRGEAAAAAVVVVVVRGSVVVVVVVVRMDVDRVLWSAAMMVLPL